MTESGDGWDKEKLEQLKHDQAVFLEHRGVKPYEFSEQEKLELEENGIFLDPERIWLYVYDENTDMLKRKGVYSQMVQRDIEVEKWKKQGKSPKNKRRKKKGDSSNDK